MLSTLKLNLILTCLELSSWSDGMQDAFQLIPIDGDGQQLPIAVLSVRSENLPLLQKSNFGGQGGNPMLPAFEPAEVDKKNYLLDNDNLFPHEHHDNIWSLIAHNPLGMHQLEQNKEGFNSDSMQAMPPHNLNKNLLNFSGPTYPMQPYGYPEMAEIDAKKCALLKTKDDKENLSKTSKKRGRDASETVYDNFWSFDGGFTHHYNQPESPQLGGFQEFSLSPTDVYFDEMYNFHTNVLQAESNQHMDQTTINLFNHQSIINPFEYPFAIKAPVAQIAASEITKSPFDSSHSSLEPNFEYLTPQVAHQAPINHNLPVLRQLEQNREDFNAALMQVMPPGSLNIEFSQIRNPKNLDENLLDVPGPSYPMPLSIYSETTEIDAEKGPLLRKIDGDKGMFETSKKRTSAALKTILKTFESTEEKKKQIVAILTENFGRYFGEDQPLAMKPIWRRYIHKRIISVQEEATDIRILEFGAKFDKGARKQIDEIKKGMRVSPMNNRKNICAQKLRMKVRLFYSITSIKWDLNNDLADKILKLVKKIEIPSGTDLVISCVHKNIEDIIIIATVIMKVISLFFSDHKNSNLFGDETNVLQYLGNFWINCFEKNPVENSSLIINKGLSVGNINYSGLQTIFLNLKTGVLLQKLRPVKKLQLTWSLISVRFGIFYPEKQTPVAEPNSTLINFIEGALLYFFMRS
ncbi:hypothetical protein BY996DRAFT_555010 [Phakopsora pachyrhizi]|nr:hypothetical protein BY996DRAFT_555010 [Phakopsora pachyrhizi]